MGLDAFLAPHVIEERCSDCGKSLGKVRPTYTLKIKGKDKPFCRDCAIKKMPKPEPREDESDGA